MIVDEADMEVEMAVDPFIEAGIDVPANLPYQDSAQEEESYKKVVKGEGCSTPKIAKKIPKMSDWVGRRGSDSNSPTTFRTRKNHMTGARRGFPKPTLFRKSTTRYVIFVVLSEAI